MTDVPKERCLLDMPDEILFEILRRIEKGKLFGISEVSSKFGNVAKDTRLWKDVYIRYEPHWVPGNEALAFEELYSGPFPVEVVDLTQTRIKSPVSFETDQVVKVTTLKLTVIRANEVTVKAILAKYQCTKLHLEGIFVKPYGHGHAMGVAPDAFSQQTALEVLSLKFARCPYYVEDRRSVVKFNIVQWLVTVLSKYCKNLKSLDLSYCDLSDLDLTFVKRLPTTLEKLFLGGWNCPENSFFELLAQKLPNLKEIGLFSDKVECLALLEFKYLEALHIITPANGDVRYLYEYLIRFPALKKVHTDIRDVDGLVSKRSLEVLRTKLEPHGIAIVEKTKIPAYPKDGNLWRVSRPRAI